MEGYFLATGGGSEIGASSYCLSLGNNRVILDCGMRFGERKYPSIDSLFKEGIFPGSSQTGSIIVSHSHKDHFGALPYFYQNGFQRIISTPQCKDNLIKRVSACLDTFNIDQYLNLKQVFMSIAAYDFFEPFSCGDLDCIFVPAGHIDGAAMTVIFYEGQKLVYTGDFSFPLSSDEVENSCAFEFIKDADVLITESTYGYMKNKTVISSKHAQFEDLCHLIEKIYPKTIFLVHGENQDKSWSIMDEIDERWPSIKAVNVRNFEKYYMGGIIE
ncbi:MAG TPA: MBL fold metallo-hydrolase [Petrotogaceae bacterium]|jgi:Cft2 family RNA processing exonuclease|nr:MBL fold metallo-hydrolase [Petrotogaceae bacterium]HNY37686.1 MBL fold metallo-hydrolase [Petrotogaceae bacterium]HOG35029.1 MBL fold metallo-hydrolase [Petrotogaceae bacterium]HPA93751.1 MBL fold metallo-hydrolase [Petrotogaceae bacterium]HPG48292.1 MBL fold metallo-hydrolase [Petrotogaceae bacterium]